ncbi:hypothetical protein NHJ13051_009094 [Beauveria bassiana]
MSPSRSKNLMYRPIDRNDAVTREFLFKHIVSDPEMPPKIGDGLPRPPSQAGVDDLFALFDSCLLAVLICLTRPAFEKAAAPKDTPLEKHGEGWGAVGVGPVPAQLEQQRIQTIGYIAIMAPLKAAGVHRTSSISVCIAHAHQGKGHGSEAIRWALWWAFRHAAMHTVRLQTLSCNVRAVSLYERLGFVVEGRLRECQWHDGAWQNIVQLSMLDREWEALMKNSLN